MRKLGLLFLFLAFGLGGCASLGTSAQGAVSYGVNATLLAADLVTIQPVVVAAEDDIQSHLSQFSASDQAPLLAAKSAIDAALSTVQGLVSGNAATTIISLATLQSVYANAKSAYLDAKTVIVANQSKFSAAELSQLATLDAQAKALDTAFQAVVAVPGAQAAQVTALLEQGLALAAAGAKLAVVAGG